MNNSKLTTILLSIVIVLLMGGGVLVVKTKSKHGGMSLGMGMASASSTEALPVRIETVNDGSGELGGLSNSWPGEIISFGDIQIQPRREGTIVEWNVNIGQKVWKGQTIARLSAPPAMPELASMLAEQAKMLTEARVDSKAQVEFAEKKKQQLLTLLAAIEKAKSENTSVLSSTSSASSATAAQTIEESKKAVAADQQKMKAALAQALTKELQEMANIEFDAVSYYKSASRPPIYLKESLGAINGNTKYPFFTAMDKALREVAFPSDNLDSVGSAYFDAAIKIVAATNSGGDFTMEQLAELRKMISMDQMTFLEAVKDYQMSKTELVKMETEYKLMFAEKETDYAMQRKEIEEQISMLDKDILMSDGRVQAQEASYATVAGSINGGLAITAPADGIISSVLKKNGDFVEPGMAVASINTGRKEDRFVRFRIPSNLRLPDSGTELAIARPGFPKEVKHVKLIGVGTALDGNGSYLADAKFTETVDWPVNVSVRVLPDGHSTSTLFANLSAIEWNDKGASLWIVNTDNTIKKQAIKTGRTLGEKVEVYEGVMFGDRYVGKLTPELKEGIKVKEGEVGGELKLEKMDMSGHE
jgi:multidrug efflux pump subunit AcrA (membrane-fusion protein)